MKTKPAYVNKMLEAYGEAEQYKPMPQTIVPDDPRPLYDAAELGEAMVRALSDNELAWEAAMHEAHNWDLHMRLYNELDRRGMHITVDDGVFVYKDGGYDEDGRQAPTELCIKDGVVREL